MTGRELIVYILQNGLEDEPMGPVITDDGILGFMTVAEVAEKYNVGTATVYAWIVSESVNTICMDGEVYIPCDFKPPMED